MQASCCLCLISCWSLWTVLEFGGDNPWVRTSSFGAFSLGLCPMSQADPKEAKAFFPEVQRCDPCFCPSPEITMSWSLQSGQIFTSPESPSMFLRLRSNRVPHGLFLSCLCYGGCYPCAPGISWIAALSHRQVLGLVTFLVRNPVSICELRLPPVVWRRSHLPHPTGDCLVQEFPLCWPAC